MLDTGQTVVAQPPQPTTDLLPPVDIVGPKPGSLTTEFWLKIAALVLTALFASGVIPTTGPAAQIAAISATILGALGYTVGRSLVKASGAALLLMALGIGTGSTACSSTTRGAAHAVAGDVVDCTAPDRVKLEAQFGPSIEQALQRAVGLDGKVDLPSLDAIGHSLEADGWCVLEHAAAQLISAALSKIPGAPAAATAPLDIKDLAAKVAAMRVGKFGATQFELGAAP